MPHATRGDWYTFTAVNSDIIHRMINKYNYFFNKKGIYSLTKPSDLKLLIDYAVNSLSSV